MPPSATNNERLSKARLEKSLKESEGPQCDAELDSLVLEIFATGQTGVLKSNSISDPRGQGWHGIPSYCRADACDPIQVGAGVPRLSTQPASAKPTNSNDPQFVPGRLRLARLRRRGWASSSEPVAPISPAGDFRDSRARCFRRRPTAALPNKQDRRCTGR